MPGIEDFKLKPKKDKFKSARGGYSRFLQISCRQCQTKLLIYQKDGPRQLKKAFI
jgi:ribosomal protein S27E